MGQGILILSCLLWGFNLSIRLILNPFTWRIIEVLDDRNTVQVSLRIDSKNRLLVFHGLDLSGGQTKAKFDVRRFPNLESIFLKGIHKLVIQINTNSVLLHAGQCESKTKQQN